jgi:hypothetical protein
MRNHSLGHYKSFIYLDSHPTKKEKGSLIIATTTAKQSPSTHREINCFFPKDFSMPEQPEQNVEVKCSVSGLWVKAIEPSLQLNRGLHQQDQQGEWINHVGDSLLYKHFPDVKQQPIALMTFNLPVKDIPFDVPVFRTIWDANSDTFREGHFTDRDMNTWLRVPETYQKDALALVKHAIHRVTRTPETDNWYVDVADPSIFRELDKDTQLPQAHHLWKPITKGNKDGNTFNDPDAVKNSKQSHASRPLPIEIDVCYNREMDYENPKLDLRISFNPTALAHQAWTALPHEGLNRGIRRQADDETKLGAKVDVCVRPASLKNLQPFANVFTMDRPRPEKEYGKPRSFAITGHSLSPAQQMSLDWMLSKEDVGEKFTEQETVEYLIPNSSMRLTGFANTVNRSRGGVLGHDVGFGKTVVTLALIDKKSEGTAPQISIDERKSWTGDRHIHLKATIVFCPPQIVEQWKNEKEKFMGHSKIVHIVQREKDINKAQFEKADIIIANSSLVGKATYLRELAKMTGGPSDFAHEKLTDRALADLYQLSVERLGILQEALAQDPDADIADMIVQFRNKDTDTLVDIQARSVPASSRAGAKKMRQGAAKGMDKDGKRSAAQISTDADAESEKLFVSDDNFDEPDLLRESLDDEQPVTEEPAIQQSVAGPGPRTAISRAMKPKNANGRTPLPTSRPPLKKQKTSASPSTFTQPINSLPIPATTDDSSTQPRRSARNASRPARQTYALVSDDDEDVTMNEADEAADEAEASMYVYDEEEEDDSEPEVARGPSRPRRAASRAASVQVVDDEASNDDAPSDPPARKIAKPKKSTKSNDPKNDGTKDDDSKSVPVKSDPPEVIRNKLAACTFFESYSYARVVLDEFSYENRAIANFFTNTVASAKWILSGTPPLENLGQVCSIGKLLNIHVARVEPRMPDHFPSVTRGPTTDALTQAEQFRSYGDAMSTNFALERHQQAFKFLLQKLQRRETDTKHIEVFEHIVVVNMDAITSLVYNSLVQNLYDAKWDIEDLDQVMSKFVKAILIAGYGKDSIKKSGTVKEHLRTCWKKAVQTLLLQASSNLSLYRKHVLGDHQGLGKNPKAKDFLAMMIKLKTEELDTHKRRLKSHFDAYMYCSVRADENIAKIKERIKKEGAKTKTLYESQLAKSTDYSIHFLRIIDRLFAEKPVTIGSTKIRNDLLKALAPV